MSWLPRISMGLTIAQLSARLRCVKCCGQLRLVKPALEDVTGQAARTQRVIVGLITPQATPGSALSGRSNPAPAAAASSPGCEAARPSLINQNFSKVNGFIGNRASIGAVGSRPPYTMVPPSRSPSGP